MAFNSLHFIVFFVLVTLLYFRLKKQEGRIGLLLIASCYFYMSFIPEYILILGSMVIVDYFAGILIDRNQGFSRRFWLITSIVANLGVLAVFKYYNFFIGNIHDGLLLFGKSVSLPVLKIALPIGLSFHTFQAMSYTIEVYRGNQVAEKRFPVYALYVMFYPQLVAGPIERPQNMLAQYKEFREYNWDNIKEGLSRMVWGFLKKAVIADRLAMVVDWSFSHTHESSSTVLLIGAMCYYFQVYCDFSGYSDLALGAAKVMNIKLIENFKQPFFSKSVSEFWRRWHISLYSWFYDYVYNSIFFSLRNLGKIALVASVLITFSLSGLWHGAAWHFIFFGLLQAVVLIYEFSTRDLRRKLFSSMPGWASVFLSIGITFCFFILAQVFFRAESMGKAWDYLTGIFALRGGSGNFGMDIAELIFAALLILVLLVRENKLPGFKISNDTSFFAYFTFMVVICYFFGVFAENQFIYFQF